jgi:hypothetical protein
MVVAATIQHTRTAKAHISTKPATKWIVRIQPNRKLFTASPPSAGGGAPMK